MHAAHAYHKCHLPGGDADCDSHGNSSSGVFVVCFCFFQCHSHDDIITWNTFRITGPTLNPSVTNGFPSHRASTTEIFFFRFLLNKLKNRSTYWWFKTPILTSQKPAPCIGDPAFTITVYTDVVPISNQRPDFKRFLSNQWDEICFHQLDGVFKTA